MLLKILGSCLVLLAVGGCGPAVEPVVEVSSAGRPGMRTAQDNQPVVLCLGDSLTAGYGLDQRQAWPAVVQGFVDDRGWPYRVVNAGVSGETTSGGLRRVGWLLSQWNAEVVFVGLGGNDALRGIPVTTVEANLQAIIDEAREARPGIAVVLAGMRPPPNMGSNYSETFRSVYPRLAESNDVILMPFLLEDVGGDPTLNQLDGIHPTAEGQEVMAGNIWGVLEPVLEDRLP
jgi:acyl-CoA thioesterase-1